MSIHHYDINALTFLKGCFETRSARHLGASTEVQGGVDDHHGASQNHLEPLGGFGNPKWPGQTWETWPGKIWGTYGGMFPLQWGNHGKNIYRKIPIAMEV